SHLGERPVGEHGEVRPESRMAAFAVPQELEEVRRNRPCSVWPTSHEAVALEPLEAPRVRLDDGLGLDLLSAYRDPAGRELAPMDLGVVDAARLPSHRLDHLVDSFGPTLATDLDAHHLPLPERLGR